MIQMPKTASKTIVDFELSRYACYLIVKNRDPKCVDLPGWVQGYTDLYNVDGVGQGDALLH
jgi:hypothetical protein